MVIRFKIGKYIKLYTEEEQSYIFVSHTTTLKKRKQVGKTAILKKSEPQK